MLRSAPIRFKYLDVCSLLFFVSFQVCLQNCKISGGGDASAEVDQQPASPAFEEQHQCPVVSGRWETPCHGDWN